MLGTSGENLQRVLILQRHAVRILAGLKPGESCKDAFREWGILTVPAIYIIEVIMYTAQDNLQRLSTSINIIQDIPNSLPYLHIDKHSSRETFLSKVFQCPTNNSKKWSTNNSKEEAERVVH
ncbi:hypothetical protein J6590_044925 [Homalodisca vitripennis]|nr:hypothetical protein J6590_044925 [Homalodisca vitripennis]